MGSEPSPAHKIFNTPEKRQRRLQLKPGYKIVDLAASISWVARISANIPEIDIENDQCKTADN